MFTKVAHIGFTVSNIDRSVEFYKNILGLYYQGEMIMDGPETEELFQKVNCKARVAYLRPKEKSSPQIELIQFTDSKADKDTPDLFKTSISELCFMTDNIDNEYNRLKSLGVEFLSSPQTFDSTEYGFGKSRAVYFYDPDGNILELIQSV